MRAHLTPLRTQMTLAFVMRLRAAPLRMATLAFLFATAMVAAVVVPRQFRHALDGAATDVRIAAQPIARAASDSGSPF